MMFLQLLIQLLGIRRETIKVGRDVRTGDYFVVDYYGDVRREAA